MTNNESIELLERYRRGDDQAAYEIFDRYLDRLTALARSRLSERMRVRIDPDDVVQSAYRSFFRNAEGSRYRLERGGDLWRLLAAITVNKALGQIEYNQAHKRAVEAEHRNDRGSTRIPPEAIARDPSPDEALALAEELEDVMRGLEPKHYNILELRLQGVAVRDIATNVGRTTRTVQRVLETIRQELERRLFRGEDRDDQAPPSISE